MTDIDIVCVSGNTTVDCVGDLFKIIIACFSLNGEAESILLADPLDIIILFN